MSYRNDTTNLPYDLSILSSVPENLTLEEKQVSRSPIFHPSLLWSRVLSSRVSSSPSLHPPSPLLRPPAHFSPRLIGSSCAPPSISKSPTYGPATRAAGECCRACRREGAMVSHEMGDCSDRHCHRPYHCRHCWWCSRRYTSQLPQTEQRCRRQPWAQQWR